MVLTKDLEEGCLIVINETIFKVTENIKMENGLYSWTAYGLHNFEWMTTVAEREEVIEKAVTAEKELLVGGCLEISMRSWQRHRGPFAVILAFWIFCMWVNGWTKRTEREIRGIQAKTEPVVYNNLNSRIVGKECSNTTGHCYTIMDVFYRQGGMAVALRLLLLNRLPKYAFTSVSLKPSDPARGNWSVDKSLVDSHVIQAQIGFAFITELASLIMWYFIVSCCYGTVSVLCYLLILSIFFWGKGEFLTTYYRIFAYSAVVNIACYINSFMCVRLPQITSSTSFLAPIFTDFWGLEIIHCLMNHFAYLQYFFTLLLNGNRMSVVLFPLNHEKFWHKYLVFFLLFVFISPFAITHEILFGNSYYESSRAHTNNTTAPDQFGLSSTCNMDKQGKVLVGFMCISIIIGAVFNTVTLWRLKRFTKGSGSTRRSRTEVKLFIHGLINFLVDTFATIVTLGLTNPYKGALFLFCVQLLPFASDAISFVSGFVLIACSQPLTKAFRSQMGWEVESTTVPEMISRHPPTRTAVAPLV